MGTALALFMLANTQLGLEMVVAFCQVNQPLIIDL
jgi:hypothetical protein